MTRSYVSRGSSGHPVDRLIRHSALTGYRATVAEVAAMQLHIANAPFAQHTMRIAPYYAQMAARHGFHVPSMVDVLTAHIAKHIWAQEQWVATVTEAEYLEDIRTAALASSARLVTFVRNRRPRAVVIAPTEDVVPVDRRGPQEGNYILLVYSPDHAMIRTAYMIDRLQDANLPADATWLK